MHESLKTVSDVMRPGVLSVSATASLEAVGRVLHEHGVHGVLIVAHDAEPLGWITARDMLRHRSEDWRRVKAADAISEPCVSVAPSTTVSSAIDTMLAADATRLAVLRPGSRTPDGVVTDIDFVTHLAC